MSLKYIEDDIIITSEGGASNDGMGKALYGSINRYFTTNR